MTTAAQTVAVVVKEKATRAAGKIAVTQLYVTNVLQNRKSTTLSTYNI